MIKNFAPNYLVVPTGMDTFDGDPLGAFKVTREGFAKIGKRIASLGLPTTIVMEGGYANEALGENIVTLLKNFK